MVENNTVFTLQECVEIFKGACSSAEAMGFVRDISAFHRTQASRGYRAAAERAAELLRKNGVETYIRRYPADGKTRCFTQKLFKEWNCTEGWLDITAPWQERVSDFEREEMSIIQRSAAKDFSNEDISIVYLADDTRPEDFNVPLTDTLLFVENDFQKWVEPAIRLGALGIITVSIPEIEPVRTNTSGDKEICHAHGNLSFHIYDERENALCGFAISPLTGKKLRQACLDLAAGGRTPTARFRVSSTLIAGFIENVEAIIQGDIDEEILLTAHLCHPRSSVNDNASGAASAMEAMCTLQRLIAAGTLPRPRRTIRLLLMPEFTGTYAFLKENEDGLSKIRAGINLDMVAGYQNGKAGASIIVDTPDSAHSFSGDLSSIIMDQLSKECTFGGENRYIPLHLGIKVPFVTGSDHYILSDPTVNIPTVALTQWPDKTYHTSADDLDHIDPQMLQRSAALAASYCYIYSRFTVEDARAVMYEVSSRFVQHMNNLRQEKACSETQGRCNYIKELYFATLDRISTLFDGKELESVLPMLVGEKEFFLRLKRISCLEGKEENLPPSPIPLRLFKAPLAMRSIESDLAPVEKEKLYKLRSKYPQFSFLDDYIVYEADGKKTMEEIARRVYFQVGMECGPYVNDFFELLVDLGLVKLIGSM